MVSSMAMWCCVCRGSPSYRLFGQHGHMGGERRQRLFEVGIGSKINPEAWMWYYNNVGGARCPIMDTFWQTETGGHMITPLPGVTPLVPGSCTLPFPGIQGKKILRMKHCH